MNKSSFLLAMEATAKSNGSAAVKSGIPAVAHPLGEEPMEIASNINYHAQYSPHFSPFKFEPEQAYYATAESVRDRLIKVRYMVLLSSGSLDYHSFYVCFSWKSDCYCFFFFILLIQMEVSKLLFPFILYA